MQNYKNRSVKPLISIITVVYNDNLNIEKTLLSSIHQTYPLKEIIVIDGGSQDGTVDVIKKYENDLTKWVSEPDKGIYDAMNKGIDFSTGDWIIFMNSGDSFYNDRVVEVLASKDLAADIAVVYGDVELDFGSAGTMIRSLSSFNNHNVITEICHQGSMTRADILKEKHYDLGYRIMADLNSFKSIHNDGFLFQYVPLVIAKFEVTAGISATKPFLSFRESCRLRDIDSYSLNYFRSLLKATYKYLLLKILPTKTYNRIRYKKVSSLAQYKPNYE